MVEILGQQHWTALAEAHRARVDAFVARHRADTDRGDTHPVWGFLFTYYSLRPRQLRVWHPGYGVALAGGIDYLSRTG